MYTRGTAERERSTEPELHSRGSEGPRTARCMSHPDMNVYKWKRYLRFVTLTAFHGLSMPTAHPQEPKGLICVQRPAHDTHGNTTRYPVHSLRSSVLMPLGRTSEHGTSWCKLWARSNPLQASSKMVNSMRVRPCFGDGRPPRLREHEPFAIALRCIGVSRSARRLWLAPS